MCLSRPGRVLRRQGTMVEVDTGGQVRWYSALARPEVRTGDRVLTHADLVLTILTEDEAAEIEDGLALLAGGGVRGADARRPDAPPGGTTAPGSCLR